MYTDFQSFSEQSKVWIYQSNRPFSAEELPDLRKALHEFAASWVSHNRQLRAHADVWHERFIVLVADESAAQASGCSIDASVHFLKTLQSHFGVDLFNRMIFAFRKNGHIHSVDRDTFSRLYAQQEIDDDTIVFDTLVNTKAALLQHWERPLAQSWHKRMLA